MRAPAKVVVIAASVLAIGAPAAMACSPQDYMSPEEWQALSPQQQAENAGHTHAADGSIASGASTAPAPDAGSKPAAPQVTEPIAGDGTGAAPEVEAVPPKRADRANPDGERTAKRPTAADAPTSSQPAPRPSAGDIGTTSDPTSAVSPPVVAARATQRDPQVRRAERRATQRRADAREARAAVRRRAMNVRSDAAQRQAGAVPVEASPTEAQPDRDPGRLAPEAWAGLAALLVAAGALLLIRLRRRGMGTTATARTPVQPLDPVEAELQAIIAEQQMGTTTATPRAALSDAQDVGTGDASSTATNSA